jgi:hypothetical protein
MEKGKKDIKHKMISKEKVEWFPFQNKKEKLKKK